MYNCSALRGVGYDLIAGTLILWQSFFDFMVLSVENYPDDRILVDRFTEDVEIVSLSGLERYLSDL